MTCDREPLNQAAVVAAAGNTLDDRLDNAVDLGGSDRSLVLRCRSAAHGTVIVKAYRRTPEAMGRFGNEVAGLSFAHIGPGLLATDPQYPLLVMEDLGDPPSLADALLGADRQHAVDSLYQWATVLGGMAGDSRGRKPEFDAMRATLPPAGRGGLEMAADVR